MINKEKNLEKRIRSYRLAFHNINPDRKAVREAIQDELNEKVKIKNWKIEKIISYEAFIEGSTLKYPQKETLVIVQYQGYI